jgi:acyl dehydratase
MPALVSMEKLKQMIGQENGLSDWVLIDQDRINRFADVTGQRAWIHVDMDQFINNFGVEIEGWVQPINRERID